MNQKACVHWSAVRIVDRDKKPGKPSGATPAQGSDDATPSVGPYNPALAEIYQKLYPEMRRPKPNQEAIAAALQAMQRLTMKMDSETAVEESTPEGASEAALGSFTACHSCGHHNREGNKYCGMCGLPVDAATEASPASESSTLEVQPLELLDFAREVVQMPQTAPEAAPEVHPPAGAPPGAHHYHHHYHHHYFQGGVEGGIAAPQRGNAPESAREADRLRIAAAAKGEPMSRSEAAVRRLTQEWVLACNTRQLDELLELYTPDALVLRSNLPLLRGAAAVREFFFSALESGLGEVALEPIRVEVVGDVAHEVGRYSALVPGTAGKRREERGKYLWVFAKQSGGEWKLVSECWSSDLTLSNSESDVPQAAIPSPSKPRRA
jgi:uncharacterized protein (TIGR02246 family)